MAAKEKLLERMMTLSEAEADEALRLLDARRDETEDEWGNLSGIRPSDGCRRLSAFCRRLPAPR